MQEKVDVLYKTWEDTVEHANYAVRECARMQDEVIELKEQASIAKRISTEGYLLSSNMQKDINEKLKQLKNVYEVVNDSRWRESTDTLLKSTAYSLGNISCIAN